MQNSVRVIGFNIDYSFGQYKYFIGQAKLLLLVFIREKWKEELKKQESLNQRFDPKAAHNLIIALFSDSLRFIKNY